jgi:hypothetical protein
MIRWPQHSTVVAPTHFPSTASEIARLFGRASTELTRINRMARRDQPIHDQAAGPFHDHRELLGQPLPPQPIHCH